MMKIISTILCFVCCAMASYAAESSEQIWQKANGAYQQKQYDTAVFYYQKILQQEPANADVHYNIANAFYKNNQVSEAVLHYERALFFDPQLTKAKDNLLLAQKRIPNFIKHNKEIFFVRWWQNATTGNTATPWAITGLLLFISFLAMLWWNRLKASMKIPLQALIIAPILVIGALLFSYEASLNATQSKRAVIMDATSSMTTAPNVFKNSILIPQATTVIVGEEKSNWVNVTLPDNRSGWVKKSALTFVHNISKK